MSQNSQTWEPDLYLTYSRVNETAVRAPNSADPVVTGPKWVKNAGIVAIGRSGPRPHATKSIASAWTCQHRTNRSGLQARAISAPPDTAGA